MILQYHIAGVMCIGEWVFQFFTIGGCCEYTDIFPFSYLFKSLLLFWYIFAYHYLDYIILDTIHHINYFSYIEYAS